MTKERKRGLSLILAMLMLFVTFSGTDPVADHTRIM